MKFTVEKNKFKVLLFFLALYFLLSIVYFLSISNFWYWNKIAILKEEDFSFILSRYFVVTLVFIFDLLIVCKIRQKKFIFSIQALILLLFLMPSALTYASFKLIDFHIFLCHNLFLWSVILFSKVRINPPIIGVSGSRAYSLIFLITVIGIIPFLQYLPKIDISNLLLMNIYESREVLAEVGNIYTNYTYSWFTSILIPTLIVLSVFLKRRASLVVLIIMLLFMFLCGAQKSVFFGVFVVILFYYQDHLIKLNNILRGALIILVLGAIGTWVFSNDIILIYTFRRILMLPALLDYAYFDFFDENYIYWSETIGDVFIDYPYLEKHSKIIGEFYFDSPLMSANNGIVSDGFMNYGMLGVFFNICIVSIFFSIMNQLNISNKFFGLFFLFIISILSSSLSTVLLTHGGFLLFMVSIFFLRDTANTMDNHQSQEIKVT